MTFDSFALAETNFIKTEDRAIKDFGFGASKDAQALIQKHITRASKVVEAKLQDTSRKGPFQELQANIQVLSPDLIALVALQGILSSVASCAPLNRTYIALGRTLEAEMYAFSLQSFNKKLAAKLEATARKKNASAKYRKQAVRSMAKANGFKHGAWTDQQRTVAGQWLVEVALRLDDVFVLVQSNEEYEVDTPYVTITQEALEYSQAFVKALLERHPVPLPLLSCPPKWTDTKLVVESNGKPYDIPIVRRERCVVTQSYLKSAISNGTMQPVLDALTRMSSTSWMINERILEVVQWAQENHIEIEGLPPARDIPLPEKITNEAYEAMTEDQRRLRRKGISEIVEKNRSYIGERETFKRDIETAKIIVDNANEFWTPVNMDYRGRVYASCHFNFQRQDYVRSLFMFKEGKPLGDKGLYWLAIHLANCGDFDKVSKASFDDRVKWVHDHHDMILDAASDPYRTVSWWSKADAPFLFLAACFEYAMATVMCPYQGHYVCHLPISFDGSCSGLQHFAAMTRCDTTAPLVNLTDNSRPSDVYQTVADKVRVKVEGVASGDSEFSEVARLALAYGVNRSLVKRNVMTWAYSSKKFGMTQQLMEDTMIPLRDKVTLGKLDVHPFAVANEKYTGQMASKFLGHLTFDTIEETVERPAQAMRFLQGIARALAHEGKPTVWHTPLGFPVVLRYPNVETEFLQLWLNDRGVRIKTRAAIVNEAEGIDKNRAANAVAPGFVHSYDACHLQMVVNEAWARGITSVALVHDSFGCLPSEAEEFRTAITDTFHRLYSENDVLAMIHDEAFSQIDSNHHRIPNRSDVTTGSYDINEVKHAQYAFA